MIQPEKIIIGVNGMKIVLKLMTVDKVKIENWCKLHNKRQ